MSSIILEKGNDKQIVELGPSLGVFLLNVIYLMIFRRWKDAGIIFLVYSFFIIIGLLGALPNKRMLFEAFLFDLFLLFVFIVAPSLSSAFLENFFNTYELYALIINTPLEEYPSVLLSVLGTIGIIIFHILTSLFYNKIYCKRLLQQGYKSIENDKYSQQTLEYYQKHPFF